MTTEARTYQTAISPLISGGETRIPVYTMRNWKLLQYMTGVYDTTEIPMHDVVIHDGVRLMYPYLTQLVDKYGSRITFYKKVKRGDK